MTDFPLKPVPGGHGLTPWEGGGTPAERSSTGDEILLVNHHIAGTAHVPEAESLTADLELGMTVRLIREKNAYDAFATRIETADGRKLGYLPKGENVVLARLLDAGLNLYGKLTNWTMKGNWPYIRVDIFLRL